MPVDPKLDESDWLAEKSDKEPSKKKETKTKVDFSDPAFQNTSLIHDALDVGK